MGQLIKEWFLAHKHAVNETDPLQLSVFSVSSKRTVDEDDGISTKRATHWMANQPEGKKKHSV